MFFITSLSLSLLARYGEKPIDILDRAPQTQGQTQGQGGKGVLDQLPGSITPPAPPSGSDAAAPAVAPEAPVVPSGNSEPAAPQVPN